MSEKTTSAEELFFIEPHDKHTNDTFRRALAERGLCNPEDITEKVLKINNERKSGFDVPRSILEFAENSKDAVLGGPLKYGIFQDSKDGTFLNLPRESFRKKKGAKSEAAGENARLNNQLAGIQAKKGKK